MNPEHREGTENLDATTRVVVEGLAARLLPALGQTLTQRLDGSLAAAFDELASLRELWAPGAQSMMYEALTHVEEALRQEVKGAAAGRQELMKRVQGGIEEERAGRGELLRMFRKLLEELAAGQNAIQASFQGSLQNAFQGQKEGLAELQKGVVEKIAGELARQEALLRELSKALPSLERRLDAQEDRAEKSPVKTEDDAIRRLEAAFPGWEGVLKAHVQAQSHELDELSRELGDLQRQSEAALVHSLQEAARQEADRRDAEWEARLKDERAQADRRFKTVTRALWFLAGIGGLSLLFSLAGLVRAVR